MRSHEVTYECPSALKPSAHNARTHSKKQIRQVAASIKEFGFTNPILVDDKLQVIAGHARLSNLFQSMRLLSYVNTENDRRWSHIS